MKVMYFNKTDQEIVCDEGNLKYSTLPLDYLKLCRRALTIIDGKLLVDEIEVAIINDKGLLVFHSERIFG